MELGLHEEEAVGKVYDARLIQRLWPFLRPYRGRALVIGFLTVLEIGLASLAPWPLKLIVDTTSGV